MQYVEYEVGVFCRNIYIRNFGGKGLMNETIKADIIDIINRALSIIRSGNFLELRELSNHTIHDASIFQDEYSISIAVVVYSISKILLHDRKRAGKFVDLLERAERFMRIDNLGEYKKMVGQMMGLISSIDSRFGSYVDNVITQAQVKKGSKIYDHGISLGQAASILGVSQWELMQYAGHTKTADTMYERPDVIEKIKFTRGLFR
jgi:hypothetical protein